MPNTNRAARFDRMIAQRELGYRMVAAGLVFEAGEDFTYTDLDGETKVVEIVHPHVGNAGFRGLEVQVRDRTGKTWAANVGSLSEAPPCR